ncbi:antibiotic biosynthesis monooxygenase family protein, partial [Marinitenerispora sediminis]
MSDHELNTAENATVVFVNRFTLHTSPEEFERAFDTTAQFLRRQPGFLQSTLSRHADKPDSYLNIARWRDARSFHAAHLDRATQFALAATREALTDSALPRTPDTAHRIGVSLGSAVGCTRKLESQYLAISDNGRRWLVDHTRGSDRLYDYFVPSS